MRGFAKRVSTVAVSLAVLAAPVGPLTTSVAVAQVAPVCTFVTEWGSSGSGNGQFNNVWGVAVDPALGGMVFTAEQSGHRVQKFDTAGAYQAQWGGFSFPKGVDATGGWVFVGDSINHVIKKFDNAGNFVTQSPVLNNGGIALDVESMGGSVYTYEFDAGFSQVLVRVFDLDLQPVASYTIGSYPAYLPRGIGVDAAQNIYVSTQGGAGSGVQKLDSSGNLVGGVWATGGTPDGVNVWDADGGGIVFVTVQGLNQVQMFTDTGTALGTLPGALSTPMDVDVEDSSGDLYLANYGTAKIKKYSCVEGAPPISQCSLDALAAIGKTAADFPPSALNGLESACSANKTTVIPANGTSNGSIKLNAGDVLVIGNGATVNGTTQTTVDGAVTSVLFIGTDVHVNGSVKNVGTIYVTGSGSSVSGSLTDVGTLYYLPGTAPLSVGGQFSVGSIIQL